MTPCIPGNFTEVSNQSNIIHTIAGDLHGALETKQYVNKIKSINTYELRVLFNTYNKISFYSNMN